jgi:hypothetical protein
MSGVWRYPQRPKGGKFGLGRAKQPRLSEASQRSNLGRGDTFWNWRPGELVTGPPRKRGQSCILSTIVDGGA